MQAALLQVPACCFYSLPHAPRLMMYYVCMWGDNKLISESQR
jgi:hypothetical protein